MACQSPSASSALPILGATPGGHHHDQPDHAEQLGSLAPSDLVPDQGRHEHHDPAAAKGLNAA